MKATLLMFLPVSLSYADVPDFSGTYDSSTLTPFVRPKEFGENRYLTPEQADKLAKAEAGRLSELGSASDPDREAPPEGGDGSAGASGNVGGYNSFWIDRGSEAMLIDGKFRTSIIIDPPNGRFPPMTDQSRAREAKRASMRRPNDGTAWWLDQTGPGPYDDMEQRPNAERCLTSFSGSVPSIPSLYNNFKRIVQTDDYVMIMIEMVHDARVVRLNSEHPGPEITSWLGDSIGWWEGDTLVVDTTNFAPQSLGYLRGDASDLHVVERFTKMKDGNLLYQFTVTDPGRWTQPWSGEYVWRSSDQKVYEYACHEGNYALGNIMRGARLLEQDIEGSAGR